MSGSGWCIPPARSPRGLGRSPWLPGVPALSGRPSSSERERHGHSCSVLRHHSAKLKNIKKIKKKIYIFFFI